MLRSQTADLQVSLEATYSASVVDCEMQSCRRLNQVTAPPLRTKTLPEVEHR
jgi:hypothetical protein